MHCISRIDVWLLSFVIIAMVAGFNSDANFAMEDQTSNEARALYNQVLRNGNRQVSYELSKRALVINDKYDTSLHRRRMLCVSR